jgi:hypothetical protein
MKTLAFLAISIAAVGCAHSERTGFRPMGPVSSGEAGFPASRYQLPPDAPRGEAYVTSFGTRELDAGEGARSQLIHVRLAVANQSSDAPWSVDPGQQTLSAPGGAPQRPDFMEVDGKQGSSTAIPRGQRRVLDFYYRAPGGADAGSLSGFDFNWQVDTGGAALAERTAFARDSYRGYDSYGPRSHVAVGVGVVGPWWAYGYGPGWYGPWGPYGYGYGYGGGYYGYRPYYGVGLGWGRGYYGGGHYGGGHYGGGRSFGGGGFGSGGGGFGRGGGGMQAPVMRGRPGR